MENNKILHCIISPNIRGVIQQANELSIPREDIVNIFPLGEYVYLIYYK